MSLDQIIEMLLNHGSLGLFAGYLIFESNRLRRQQEATVASFTGSIDQIRADSATNEKELRTRYDNVITRLQTEKAAAKTILSDKVQALEQKTDQIMLQLEGINATLSELKMREIARATKGK